MNKSVSLGLTISLVALATAITFILTSAFSLRSFNDKVAEVEDMAEKYKRLDTLDSVVRENYYTDIDETELMNAILKGYVSGLGDDYARYMTAEEYVASQESDQGIMVGIGIDVVQDSTGYIAITAVNENTPAAESDLQPGDLIVAVDNDDVLTIGYAQAVSNIRGTEGTSVSLTVRRDGVDKSYSFVRSAFELTSAWGEMLDNRIGYIRITGFKTATIDQFQDALTELVGNGAKAIIFDLRDNGGGLLTSVEGCLDPLLPAGDVAYATAKDGSTTTIVASDSAELVLPMAVLVNENTASAAELFASALRDFDKGKIYGNTTFGKGIMQNTYSLADGGAVTMTIATYRTVYSDCYHGIGLTPDYVVDLPEDAAAIDNLEHANDTQLQKAISTLLEELN